MVQQNIYDYSFYWPLHVKEKPWCFDLRLVLNKGFSQLLLH